MRSDGVPWRLGTFMLLGACWVALVMLPIRLGATMPPPVWVVYAALVALFGWGTLALLKATRDTWARTTLTPSFEKLPALAPGAADPDAPERYTRPDMIRNVLSTRLPSEREVRLFETVDAFGVPTQRVWVRLRRWTPFGQREWGKRVVDRGGRLPASDLPGLDRATAKGNWLALTLHRGGAERTLAWLSDNAAAVEALAGELDRRAEDAAPRELAPSRYEAYPWEAPAAAVAPPTEVRR